MVAAKFIPVVLKQVWRHRTGSALTVLGVAAAMFLFCSVLAVQRGVADATRAVAGDTSLVVYRENRYCPFTSRLPQNYTGRIARLPGVAGVVPMRIVVSNCRASLDVVTFRGVPDEAVTALGLEVAQGSVPAWEGRSDGALVGDVLAARRGLKVGEMFDAAGITVYVAGIVRSENAQDRNSAYVHLSFLQRVASGKAGMAGMVEAGEGIVTQYLVKVIDPAQMEGVAKAIDEEFRHDAEPTYTSPQNAFVARAAGDIIEMVGFLKWLGVGCLAAMMALVANAIVLGVQDRVKEHAVLRTLGYRNGLIARLIVTEGLVLSVAGGVLGAAAAWAFVRLGRFTMTVEGVSMNVSTSWWVVLAGLGLSVVVGVVSALAPAWLASRREIAGCFRAV